MYNIMQVVNTFLKRDYDEPQEEYKALCPFHNDTNPSLHINNETGMWICHACGIRGATIEDLIARIYDVPVIGVGENSEQDALDILADGIQLEQIYIPSVRSIKKELLYAVNLEAAKHYATGDFFGDPMVRTDFTRASGRGVTYLLARSFYPSTLDYFHFADWFRFQSHPIFIPLMFDGEVYGYQQRRIYKYIQPKMLTMEGMERNEHIYGISQGSDKVLVVESMTDVAMAFQYGWPYGIVCILGSYLSDKQAQLLASRFKVIYLAYNTDEAGERAYAQSVQQLQPYERELYKFILPTNDVATCPRQWFEELMQPIINVSPRILVVA